MNRALRWLHRVEDGLLGLMLIGLVLLSSSQILRRWLFQEGWVGAEAAGRSLVLWIALLGALAATREARHVRIDIAERWLPGGWAVWVRRLSSGIAAAVCGVLAWVGMTLVALEREFAEPAFAGVPGWWVSLIIPIGFALMSLRFALQTVWTPPPIEASP